METQKIIELGRYNIRASGRGFVVTIPQAWLDANSLKAKDKLSVYDIGDGRILLKKVAKNGN